MDGFRRRIKKYEGLAIRDLILGGQDGMVNVLGIVLGVATATPNISIILVAGFSGAVAEAFSMGAVAYTSSKTFEEYIKGHKGNNSHIESNSSPVFDSVIVFLSAFFGAAIPLIPFMYFSVEVAIMFSLAVSLVTLFLAGSITGKISNSKNWLWAGLRVLLIGAGAALLGYLVGTYFQNL